VWVVLNDLVLVSSILNYFKVQFCHLYYEVHEMCPLMIIEIFI
jgi:hypothetical protein